MAQKKTVITTITDDLDGTELKEDEAQLVTFGWAGVQYEIDLSKSNAGKIEKFLTPYVEAARRVTTTRTRSRGSSNRSGGATTPNMSKEQREAIRTWANSNGYSVGDRGRIKAEVVEAFEAAHQSGS